MRSDSSPSPGSVLLRFFLVIFLGAMVVGPALYFATGSHWPFHRVMDRSLMITALAALGLEWSRLRFGEWWPLRRRAITQALLGLLMAFIAVQTILAIDYACGGLAGAHITSHQRTKVITTALVAALFVPLIEETIFRGFLQTEMVRGLGWRWGWMLTALIYALAHFLKISTELDHEPVHLWSGVTGVGSAFLPLGHGDFLGFKGANLLILGLILGGTFIRTGTLWVNYGLHGGLIIGQQLSAGLTRPARVSMWTGEDLLSSPLTTLVLVVLGWWLWRYYRRPQPEESEPESGTGPNAP